MEYRVRFKIATNGGIFFTETFDDPRDVAGFVRAAESSNDLQVLDFEARQSPADEWYVVPAEVGARLIGEFTKATV